MRVNPFLSLRNDLSWSVQNYPSTWNGNDCSYFRSSELCKICNSAFFPIKYRNRLYYFDASASDITTNDWQFWPDSPTRYVLTVFDIRFLYEFFAFFAWFLATWFKKILFGPVASHFRYKQKVWAAFALFHFRHHETKDRYNDLKLNQLQNVQPKAFLRRQRKRYFRYFWANFIGAILEFSSILRSLSSHGSPNKTN